MTPLIMFDARTIRVLKQSFGQDKPFVVAGLNPIVGNKGDRVTLANACSVVAIPRVMGLEVGQVLYVGTDDEVYAWPSDMVMEFASVSDNQTRAIAYALRPILSDD
ncbi:hypothetical protein pEaSNUABM13_00047 [Erwinia phage pEa_SNUABM_13]|nr:hypothetical protein pEaSNUABM13_00047 [Erwinia phage pEa_SNUABM_13]QYW05061.1 hypothetical protein pEaSNUABM21_00047 [Erwinia phage pEa_SNUABM_21]